ARKMPRWGAIMRLPKPATVVRPLTSTAKNVLRGSRGPPPCRASRFEVKELATPESFRIDPVGHVPERPRLVAKLLRETVRVRPEEAEHDEQGGEKRHDEDHGERQRRGEGGAHHLEAEEGQPAEIDDEPRRAPPEVLDGRHHRASAAGAGTSAPSLRNATTRGSVLRRSSSAVPSIVPSGSSRMTLSAIRMVDAM